MATLTYYEGGLFERQHNVYLGSAPSDRRGRKLMTLRVRDEDWNTTVQLQTTSDKYSGVVQKSVFSSKMRMILPVGIEGTGHHVMNEALTGMCELGTVVCPVACDVNRALYQYMGTPKDELHYKVGLKKLQDAMEALVLTANGLNDGTVLAIFGKCAFRTMSFPSFGGPDKPLQHVDLTILAREAENVGIDLRFIYLGRSAKNILVSTTQHRNFGGT